MTDSMTIADYLRAAADELLVHGWKQLDQGYADEEKCASGAIRFVVGGDPERCTQLSIRIEDWIAATFDHVSAARWEQPESGEYVGVPAWNDQPGRRADEVVALLLIAADEWEASQP